MVSDAYLYLYEVPVNDKLYSQLLNMQTFTSVFGKEASSALLSQEGVGPELSGTCPFKNSSPQDKRATISQTIFSDAFSWKKVPHFD